MAHLPKVRNHRPKKDRKGVARHFQEISLSQKTHACASPSPVLLLPALSLLLKNKSFP